MESNLHLFIHYAFIELYRAKYDACVKKNNKPIYLINDNVTDWNTINDVGWYSGRCDKANGPQQTDFWLNCIVLASNGSSNFLFLFGITRYRIYSREMNNGSWNNWHYIDIVQ